MNHPNAEDFTEYVTGALVDASRFEEHIQGCESCSSRLQAECRFEQALVEVANAPAVSSKRAWKAAATLGIAAAAGLAVLVGSWYSQPPADNPGMAACGGSKAETCIASAFHRGQAVAYPELHIPRYEELGDPAPIDIPGLEVNR